jgi:hypothetical protein
MALAVFVAVNMSKDRSDLKINGGEMNDPKEWTLAKITELIVELRKQHPKASLAKLVKIFLKLADDDQDLKDALTKMAVAEVVEDWLVEAVRAGRLKFGPRPGTFIAGPQKQK